MLEYFYKLCREKYSGRSNYREKNYGILWKNFVLIWLYSPVDNMKHRFQ